MNTIRLLAILAVLFIGGNKTVFAQSHERFTKHHHSERESMLEDLPGMTEEQLEQLKVLKKEQKESIKPIKDQMRKLKEEMRELREQEDPNIDAMREKIMETGNLRTQIELSQIEYHQKFREVLTEEQQAALRERKKAQREKHMAHRKMMKEHHQEMREFHQKMREERKQMREGWMKEGGEEENGNGGD